MASSRIAASGYVEADLIVECRKIYWDDFNPKHFLDTEIEGHYAAYDYHRIYFGEVVAIFGDGVYSAVLVVT